MTMHRSSPRRWLLYSSLFAALFASTPAWAQLSRVGVNPALAAIPVRGTDVAYDPANGIYLVVGAYGRVQGVFTDANGNPLTGPFLIDDGGGWAHYPRVAYSRDVPNGAGGWGGFLITWHDILPGAGGSNPPNYVHTRVVAYAGGVRVVTPQRIITSVPSWHESGAGVAYSQVSRVFLVVWRTPSIPGVVPYVVWGALVGLDGQVAIGPFQVSDPSVGARDPNVAWNSIANDFGVVYTGFGATSATTTFSRVSVGGAVVRRNLFNAAPATFITDLAFNPSTGRFVAAWFQSPGGTIAAEIDGNGDVVAQGLVSTLTGSDTGLGLSYNPGSGTFLLVGQGQATYNVSAAELNSRGARTSADGDVTSSPGATGSYYPRAAAGPGSRWDVSFEHDANLMLDQILVTSSSGGGPAGSLGGAVSGGGGSTPPPPAPGGCPGTAPFPGAVCVNGGWVPGTTSGGSTGGTTSGGCTTSAPGTGWVCVNGGWVPGTTTGSTGGTTSGGCTSPAPGSGWVCVNGGWVPGTGSTGGTSSCATPSPGTNWVCVNGGWVPATSSCTTASPGAGWICVNGGWVPGTTTSASTCTTPSPGAGWVCVNGGWTPGTTTSSSGSCTTPSPGSGWVCVNGGWVPATSSCSTASPGSGWTCVNGGWLPPGTVTTFSTLTTTSSGGCTTPDPFTAIGGGVCVNGGWRPRN